MQKTFYSIVEGRKKLGALIHQVSHSNQIIALGHHGKTEAFLVPVHYVDAEKTEGSSKTLTLEDVGDLYDRIRGALEVLKHALLAYPHDRNPMRFYYWAAQWKARGVLNDIVTINQTLIHGNYDLQKLKILSSEKSAWLARVVPLQEIPSAEMKELDQWGPVYLQNLDRFLASLAR